MTMPQVKVYKCDGCGGAHPYACQARLAEEQRALEACYQAAKKHHRAYLWQGHPAKDRTLDELRDTVAAVERARGTQT